jgi:L-threonylcarbamoyladenylate synthase
MNIVSLDRDHPERAFARCGEALAAGGLIVYPTDTFYGLGADPRNAAAVRRLFEVKRRARDRPILLLIGEARDVRDWAAELPPAAEELMQRYWPGPLTLVFRARENVCGDLTARTGSIGLRVPGSALTRDLLRYLGHPLTGTSANVSGGPNPRTAQETEALAGSIELTLDGGPAPGGRPSTVVDVSAGAPRIVREGAVPARELADLGIIP